MLEWTALVNLIFLPFIPADNFILVRKGNCNYLVLEAFINGWGTYVLFFMWSVCVLFCIWNW